MPLGGLLLPLPETFACRYCCALPARYNGHRAALEGEFTVSEQANYGVAHAFGARLLSYADNAALPVDVHDFSDAINRCLLVDKICLLPIYWTAKRLLRFVVGPRVLARA